MKKKSFKQPKVRKPKKFRSQFIASWLVANYKPCKVLDVGGGKGLLSYLLNCAGWQASVCDPFYQELPNKYTDLNKEKVIIQKEAKVCRITQKFTNDLVADFDLILGLHAHGANMQIIDACAEYKKDFMLLPCCVIDEPIEKREDVDWRLSLVDYAREKGFIVKEEQFNFKGKNVALYTDANLVRRTDIDNGLIKFLLIADAKRIIS